MTIKRETGKRAIFPYGTAQGEGQFRSISVNGRGGDPLPAQGEVKGLRTEV